jgi:DNA-binding XRE family transcriptional regulator
VAARRSPYSHGASEIHGRGPLARVIKAERHRLGERLRELRLKLEWSQARAAEQIGVHPVHVARLESGTANPTISTLIAFSVAYGVPVRALFDEAKEP